MTEKRSVDNGGNIMAECGKQCEVYSRIVGYFRPVQNWNAGKQEEFKDRLEYSEQKSLASATKVTEKLVEIKSC
jgi:glucan biosynthesis protein